MKKTIPLVLAAALLPQASFALMCPLGAGATVRRIVACKPEITTDQCRAVAGAEGCSVVRELESIHAIVIEVAEGRADISEANLKARAEIAYVDKDPKVKWIESGPEAVRDAPFPPIAEFLRSARPRKQPAAQPPADAGGQIPWGVSRVDAPALWQTTQGGGVNVAVIDTGIDYNHPDLAANVAGGVNIIAGTNDFKDDQGHGTHVSGIIAAVQGGGATGVAPQARLYGVKVLDSSGSGNYDDIIAGIEWAAKNRIQVANMSLGAPEGSDALHQAIIAAAQKGLTLVVAAGNTGGSVQYPAKYPEVIAVSATDKNDALASFSSRGPEVAFAAPGAAIYSTYMGGGYKTLSGTSMASPHVAGLAALAVSLGAQGPGPVRSALEAAAQPLPGLSGDMQGAGMIDAARLAR